MIAAICAVWGIACTVAFSCIQTALSAAHASMQAKQTAYETQQLSYRAMQRVISRMPAPVVTTNVSGSSAMAYRLSQIAQDSGAQMTAVTFADPTVAAPGGTGASVTPAAPITMQATFAGSFESLLRFVDSLSDSPYNIQITTISLERTKVDPRSGLSRVEMRINASLQL